MNLFFLDNISIGWRDILDILLVTLLFYNLIIMVKRTRAVTAIYGLIIIIVGYFAARVLGLTTLNWLLEYVLGSLFLLVVIVFQRDIRHALTTIGTRRIQLPFIARKGPDEDLIATLSDAAQYMAQRRIGALIVIERHVPLDDVSSRAVAIDALVSKELLISLFWPNSPLHDGAVIIRGKRIASGGCILPLSTAVAKRDYGTRHRAALGISEETDAVVIVVSEERGAVSLAVEGRLTAALDAVKLPKVLASAMEKKL